ncbi:MAG: hypothetical protein DMG65_06290 [Candidatus Angelobacter sp. Gp1-AA117]|nr:MAG: hypothetical protein DMG65_06290 [Candidatus Angelobacter sp. Gp1-AA117]
MCSVWSANRLFRVLVLSMTMLAVGLAAALDPSKSVRQYVSKSFTVADGLPQPWVQAIAQTPDGYMWFGTQEGLSRFNGEQFTNFDKGNVAEINHNNIRVLLPDKKEGALWIGTYGGGLTRYFDGKFRTYTVADGLPGDFVLALAWGSSGDLWIGTDKGLVIYAKGRIVPFKWPGENTASPVSDLAAGTDGTMWFLVRNAIYQADKQGNISRIAATVPEPQKIYADRSGSLWIGTMNHGVYKWVNGKIISYSVAARLPKAPVRVLYEDSGGKMWVAAYGVALCRLGADEKFDCYYAKDGPMELSIVSMDEDHEGNLWLGTEANGMICLRDTNFVTYNKRVGFSDSYVLGIYEGRNGDIWTGGRQGLNRIRNGNITAIRVAPSVSGNTVEVIEDAGNGDLWLGTEYGLKLLRGDQVVRTYTTRDGLATNTIHAMLRDHEGALWIGDRNGGLTRYKNGIFTRFTAQDGLDSTRVRHIFEDHEGSLWFSTEEGLTRYSNKNFTNLALEKGKGGATGGAVCVHEDGSHVMWIGTYGSGLVRFHDGKFVSFKTRDGLFDDSIWSIVEDDSGNLWMSSNRGLFRTPKTELNEFAEGKITRITSTPYGTADGLLTTDFNGGEQNTGWKTREGKLLFASSIGLVEVDPRHFKTNTLPPPVVIEAAMVDKRSILSRETVPIGGGELEFHFAGLSFVAPQKVAIKYKLEGFDKDWTFAGTRRVAYYTNIPPGQYQFRVLAANNDGVWNTSGASIDLYLKPHFYQTTWFGLLCSLSVLLMAAGAYRVRISQLRNREEELVALVDGRTRNLQAEIVQRKAAEEQLQEQVIERNRATEKAQAAARTKGEFLANMSHEIRTPLNGVIGTLDLAAQTELTGEQKELLSMCRSSANSLLAVLNDILDFSKIEAGKLRFEEAEFHLADTVGEAVRVMAVSAHQKKLELAYCIDPEVPAWLRGDSTRLKQVLLNLLGNAVKFTQQGEILVSVQAEKQESQEIALNFSVSDTGIGIPPDKQESIFEAFSQADTSVTRQFGGTGLGLAICARIINLLGGRIWVESTPGRGSTFHFTVTLNRAQEKQAADSGAVPVSLSGRRIMVVDDNSTNCWILERMLRAWGAAVVACTSALEALTELKSASRNGQHFDLLICGSHMPEMDGFVLLQQVKGDPGLHLKTIMMLSSNDYAAAAERCRRMQVEAWLIKPIGPSELRSAVTSLLSPEEQTESSVPTRTGSQVEATGKLRILLAEDNLVNQKLAVKMLEKLGHEVTVMENGRLAVQHLRKDTHYDVVLMDVHMPEMDGYAATEAIRQLEDIRGMGEHIPIIAMTANAMEGDRDQCLEKGMDGYIAKPVNMQELAHALQQVVSPGPHSIGEAQTWMDSGKNGLVAGTSM